MTATRVYSVAPTATVDGKPAPGRLVRASHPSHALRHVAAEAFAVRVASQDDLIAAIKAGAEVEDIKAEQHELPG